MANAVIGETGYERRAHDAYFTEPWCTEALLDQWKFSGPYNYQVWEPACGRGDITKVLHDHRYEVYSTDLYDHGFGTIGPDYLTTPLVPMTKAIVTNPPYTLSEKFIERSLQHITMRSLTGARLDVALLLRADFDSAKTRRKFFKDCHHFQAKVTLTKRPRWDWWERELPQAGPRFNYAWFIWSSHPERGSPALLYAP